MTTSMATTQPAAEPDKQRLWELFRNSKPSSHPCRSQSDDPKQGMAARYETRVVIFSRPGSRPRGLWGLAVALTGREACVSLRTFGGTSRGERAHPLPLVGEHAVPHQRQLLLRVSRRDPVHTPMCLACSWKLLSKLPLPQVMPPVLCPLIWGYTSRRHLTALHSTLPSSSRKRMTLSKGHRGGEELSALHQIPT